MPGRSIIISLVILAGVGLAVVSGTRAYVEDELAERDRTDTLKPIAALVDENAQLLTDLRREGLADKKGLLLDEYLSRVRHDGVSLHVDSKRRVDALVNNNTAIATLLSRYESRARTAGFKAASAGFRDYAVSLRDRWQLTAEISMGDEKLPPPGAAVSPDLSAALLAETASIP